MNNQNRYSKSILVITLLIILVVVVGSSKDRFRQGSDRSALPALLEDNIILTKEIEELESGTLLVLDSSDVNLKNQSLKRIYFSLDSAVSSDFLKSVRKSALPIVIVANSPNIVSKLWMILSQVGVKDLIVCRESEDETVLKYEFRPDTEVSN